MNAEFTRWSDAERTTMEHCLEMASFAVWEARHELGEYLSANRDWAEWRTHLRTAWDALSAADAIVAEHMSPPA